MDFRKEYFIKPYYFYLIENKDDVSLYFNYSETLTESRKDDKKININKKGVNKIKSKIKDITKSKKIKNLKDLESEMNSVKTEVDEFINKDLTFASKKTPLTANANNSTVSTMDQTIAKSRQTINPLTRGFHYYYWGEGEEKSNDVVSEINLTGTYGREETENLSGPETFKVYKDVLGMEPEEAAKRTKQQGKTPDPKQHKKRLKLVPKRIKNDPNFIDRMTLVEKEKIEEERKTKALKMIEDIVIDKKDSPAKKTIKKNISNLKKMAEKNGISITELIKMMKSGE
jgi:hypothetical protein